MIKERLPVIDFSDFLSGTLAQKLAVADKIMQASQDWGFFYLINFGIDKKEIDQAFLNSKIFFNLPVADKNELAWQNAQSNQGYVAVKRETLDPTAKADLKEAFNISTEIRPTALEGNCWPKRYPEFKPQIRKFIERCTYTCDRVLEAFALALELPESFFVKAHDKRQHTFRLLHYPGLPTDFQEEAQQNRAGAHTDYGSITLLFQDQVGGLEVKSRHSGWVKATPIAGSIVVNTGDLMQRWTNDVLKSNLHRVRQPAESRHQDRYSIAYFCSPNSDFVVECIDSCQSKNNPVKYSAITTAEHMLEKLNRTY
ncbi:isopenicillin N synthase family dioxygenase [Gayadomonas joobiniege]|uniref:isopenicillin N synthase family dioxygenase n=1 Tax=Gayadomonas joobiniege TaxID=1234606 RepID=UPI00036CB62C|nr:2-oxoglutarate and iron-dependent oxygenase domain-containing protein [Gayadomonas joobiniege]